MFCSRACRYVANRGIGNPRYRGGPDPEVGRRAKAAYKRRNREQVAASENARRRRRWASDGSYRKRRAKANRARYVAMTAARTDALCSWCRTENARVTSKFCSRECRYAESSTRQYRGGPSRSVIQRTYLLRRQGKLPGTIVSASQIREIFDVYDHRCVYCGGPGETIEHMIPLARGGLHEAPNISPACGRCNCQKGRRTPMEFLKRPAPWLFVTAAPS